ncbi:hypothetical protein [Corynebacterium appendicis]|nr:hypothetical protein [Corynebacterium appendicis]MDK8626515.1 hypothetical protein [Corynebacterium appendicis]
MRVELSTRLQRAALQARFAVLSPGAIIGYLLFIVVAAAPLAGQVLRLF